MRKWKCRTSLFQTIQWYIKNRRLSTHGGLILYIHDDFAFKELNSEIAISHESNLFESIFVELWRKSCSYQKYILGNVYRLPLYGIDDLTLFTNEFTTLLNLLKTRSNFIYLCGDYNIDILKMSSNHVYNTFYENVISCSFAPKITLPTRICDTTSTLIFFQLEIGIPTISLVYLQDNQKYVHT